MKTSTIATAIAAFFLTVGFAPASSAQDNSAAADSIEVITITAKRPAQTVATVCVNEARAQAAANKDQDNANATETRRDMRSAIRQCIDQALSSTEARS